MQSDVFYLKQLFGVQLLLETSLKYFMGISTKNSS